VRIIYQATEYGLITLVIYYWYFLYVIVDYACYFSSSFKILLTNGASLKKEKTAWQSDLVHGCRFCAFEKIVELYDFKKSRINTPQ